MLRIRIHRNAPGFHLSAVKGATCAILALFTVFAGCSTMGARGEQLVPTNHRIRTGPFLISSDFELKPESPLVRSLESLEADVAQSLNLETAKNNATIEIYILNDRESFTHFLRFYYPELPSRRAFFIAQGESRVVYTFRSNKLEEDLRHEATHALLNLRFGDLPLWLDEGLAEYFEVTSPALAGSHEHLDKLPANLSEEWKPDLTRLERLVDIRQMTPADYREAWAWVHLMLNQGGDGAARATLVEYLRESPKERADSRLSERLVAAGVPCNDAALVAYLTSVRDSNRRVTHAETQPRSAPAKDRVIRFQDRPAESVPIADEASPPREQRGLFRRIGSFLFGD